MGYVGRKPTDAPLTSADISDGIITESKIASDAVTSAKIAPATVASSDIAPATIAASNIAPATITSSQIAPGTVAASNIATGTITTTQISPSVTLGVPAVTSDPPSPSLSLGNMWLRTDLTSNQLKCWLPVAGTFSSLSNSPYSGYGGAATGSSDAGMVICRYGSPLSAGDNGARGYDHQHFDGTTWSQKTNFPYPNSGTCLGGTQSASVAGGGHGNPGGPNSPLHPSYSATTISYEWDGSAWGGSVTMAYYASSLDKLHSTSQTNTFIATGWYAPGGTTTAKSQSYNGSVWTLESDAPYASQDATSSGPGSDSLIFNGNVDGTPYVTTNAASWNGANWSTENSTSLGTTGSYGSYGGTASGGQIFKIAGDLGPGQNNTTEVFNGTSWSTDATSTYSSGGGNAFGGVGNTPSTRGIIFGINSGTAGVQAYNGPGNAVVNLN